VEIEFISGRNAILTIFADGQETERVELQDIATEQEMHQMMMEKGFVLKAPEEVERIKREGAAKKENDEQGRDQRMKRARKRMETRSKAANDGPADTSPGEAVKEADDLHSLPDDENTPEQKEKIRQWKEEQWKAAQAKKQALEEAKASERVGVEL
jgi:hypothetical protein